MNPVLLSIIVGIAVFIFIILIIPQEKKSLDPVTAKRLSNIKNKPDHISPEDEGKDSLESNLNSMIEDTEYTIRLLGNFLEKIKQASKVKKMLKLAGIKMTPDIFILVLVILMLPFLLLALLIPERSMMFLIIGIIFSYIPVIIAKIKTKKRLEMFTQQLPDGLGLVSNSLRAGHSLQSSFQMVHQEMPDPISHVFKIVVDDISLGKDTRDAMESMIENMPGSLDLRFFVTAVLIQREIGGNLAEILDNLSYTIRERFKLIGQLKAQTAQAKLSGIVLACAPAVIGFIIWFMNPEYMEPLFHTLLGQIILAIAFILAIIGFMIINKITSIKV